MRTWVLETAGRHPDAIAWPRRHDGGIEADGGPSRPRSTPAHAAIADYGLGGRRLVFMLDGETRTRDMTGLDFRGTDHVTYLDWHHRRERT